MVQLTFKYSDVHKENLGFWHLKKICCQLCVLYLVLAKEGRWTGIALETLGTLANAEASKDLASITTELAFPQASLLCPFL